ncbi:hypothetical protein J6590_082142, partial [Homalodisca vitripennis]
IHTFEKRAPRVRKMLRECPTNQAYHYFQKNVTFSTEISTNMPMEDSCGIVRCAPIVAAVLSGVLQYTANTYRHVFTQAAVS